MATQDLPLVPLVSTLAAYLGASPDGGVYDPSSVGELCRNQVPVPEAACERSNFRGINSNGNITQISQLLLPFVVYTKV